MLLLRTVAELDDDGSATEADDCAHAAPEPVLHLPVEKEREHDGGTSDAPTQRVLTVGGSQQGDQICRYKHHWLFLKSPTDKSFLVLGKLPPLLLSVMLTPTYVGRFYF